MQIKRFVVLGKVYAQKTQVSTFVSGNVKCDVLLIDSLIFATYTALARMPRKRSNLLRLKVIFARDASSARPQLLPPWLTALARAPIVAAQHSRKSSSNWRPPVSY